MIIALYFVLLRIGPLMPYFGYQSVDGVQFIKRLQFRHVYILKL